MYLRRKRSDAIGLVCNGGSKGDNFSDTAGGGRVGGHQNRQTKTGQMSDRRCAGEADSGERRRLEAVSLEYK